MRRKDQTERRRQLEVAARQVLLERGAVGIRVKDIADRAGMAPSSVLYYYPEIEDLLFDVSRDAVTRYAEQRAEAVRELDDPVAQLRLAVRLGVPDGTEDEESRILYELDAFTGTSAAFGILTTSFFDRQVSLYETVLQAGAATGAFRLARPALETARGIVAMEDGLGLQVVTGHPGLDRDVAERILLGYAAIAAGVEL